MVSVMRPGACRRPGVWFLGGGGICFLLDMYLDEDDVCAGFCEGDCASLANAPGCACYEGSLPIERKESVGGHLDSLERRLVACESCLCEMGREMEVTSRRGILHSSRAVLSRHLHNTRAEIRPFVTMTMCANIFHSTNCAHMSLRCRRVIMARYFAKENKTARGFPHPQCYVRKESP